MKKIVVLIALLCTISGVNAQSRHLDQHSIYFGAGGNMFMGDLGGGSQDAAHFLGLRDVDLAAFRPSFCLGYGYKVYDNLAVRAGVTYSRVYGDDKETPRISRESRNLNFRSDIFSIGFNLDYYFVKEKEIPRYATAAFSKRIAAYFTVGFGFFHFNPQGEYLGQWYDLQPLCTEGQGTNITYIQHRTGEPDVTFTTASAPYKLWAAEIPFGLGAKIAVNRKLSVSAELAFHATTTDYIDDCSTNTFNWEQEGLTPPSEMTMIMSDKRVTAEGVDATPLPTGCRRGESGYNDAYVTFLITAHYKLINRYGKQRKH